MPPRHVAQPGRRGARQTDPLAAEVARPRRARCGALRRKVCRRDEPSERPPPVRLRGRQILPPEPGDVVAERPRDVRPRILPPRKGPVQELDLLEENRQRPAVQEDVVVAPDELVEVARQTHHRQTLQRRARQVVAPVHIVGQESPQSARPTLRVVLAPVEALETSGDAPQHDLQRSVEPVPDESRAQDRVTLDGPPPGALERVLVERPVERPGQLLDVDTRRRRRQRVVQHPLLHRREGIDVLDVRMPPGQEVERGLVETRQRKIRRRVRGGPGPAAQRDEGAQRRFEATRQRLDACGVVQAVAVFPIQSQPAGDDAAVDLEKVRARSAGAGGGTWRLGRQPERGRRRHHGVELTQVIEGDLRLRKGLEPQGDVPVPPQIAQEPVADAARRHRPQLLLDRLERLLRPACVFDREQDRLDRGEPADRA